MKITPGFKRGFAIGILIDIFALSFMHYYTKKYQKAG